MRGRKELGVFVSVCGGVFGWRRGVGVSMRGGCRWFEGADGFDNGCELCFGSICSPWAGACVGSGVVGK